MLEPKIDFLPKPLMVKQYLAVAIVEEGEDEVSQALNNLFLSRIKTLGNEDIFPYCCKKCQEAIFVFKEIDGKKHLLINACCIFLEIIPKQEIYHVL